MGQDRLDKFIKNQVEYHKTPTDPDLLWKKIQAKHNAKKKPKRRFFFFWFVNFFNLFLLWLSSRFCLLFLWFINLLSFIFFSFWSLSLSNLTVIIFGLNNLSIFGFFLDNFILDICKIKLFGTILLNIKSVK